MGAPRSRAWEAWACRIQCGETARSMPARAAACRTMRSTASGFRGPPRLRDGKRGRSSPASPRNFTRFFQTEAGRLNGPGLIALAEDRDLAAIAIGLRVPPAQAAHFADAHRRGIEQGEQNPVALLWFETQDRKSVV